MDYNKETQLNTDDASTLIATFNGLLLMIKHISVSKASRYIQSLPTICRLHYKSLENRRLKNNDINKLHPVIPQRGEIYNAHITEGIGSELCNNHLVLIVQNQKGNMYGEKINVLPIEGDGSKINSRYQFRLSNNNMEDGRLNKDPSRVIISDITTIDKARLGRRIGRVKLDYMFEVGQLLKKQLSL